MIQTILLFTLRPDVTDRSGSEPGVESILHSTNAASTHYDLIGTVPK